MRKIYFNKLSKSNKYLIYTLVIFLLNACTSVQIESGAFGIDKNESDIKRFSELEPVENGFQGWYAWTLLPSKNKTDYQLEKYQGKTVLRATAKSSASGMAVPLKPRSAEGLQLAWSWKALNTIPNADNTVGRHDDAPLRIMLAFDGDKSKLSFKDQMAFEMAHLISGHEMPYATLMYIWAGATPVETVITNQHVSRVRMLVVDSGKEGVGDWRSHLRNIGEDYRKSFGESPGKLIGIGVMTDSDNTKTEVKSIYGDIELINSKNKRTSMTPLLK
jgi:hypothetical protein